MSLLEGKTAVVTGAASGNGRAIAELFAEHGAAVVVADVRDDPREGGEPTHELVESRGGDAVFVECDVTNYDDCVDAVEAADPFGGVDIMVNNAGIVGPQVPLVELDMDDYRTLMAVNLDGVFHGSKAAALAMVEHGNGGSIVNMSSVAGMVGYGGITPYSAAKGGVRLFSYALANELGPDGVRVNVVHPGVIETAMTTDDSPIVGTEAGEQLKAVLPLRRFGTPEDVAGVCLFLASDLSSYVTAESIVVDGGNLNSA
ncbi:NAD(P)-dependent dehydrogenase, short-chain alcohol dehydrogenase family [Halogranum gelatinilyticum]|uniref:NAD(P)-dependent dehydrogenase, short-chain alcohol dehydrogenase family n=1 Tax=Halogranum gelatinilyticum TaxID=660521 RepID=A0A1G9YL90_9EURY|nr:SDR family oxidoreductase [Halogranum gelatinilyticum]SDN09732.1 NAD(P)-dependent dehydrogenase, short-chain alcohol dehydrogenase family [Halogranum gelatinilyticum]